MSLAKLAKIQENRVLGIDASTRSVAFCLFDNKTPIKWGEVFFDGGDVYERILDAKKKVHAIAKTFPSDFVALEAAVMVRSANTGLKMAYVFGAIMGELIADGRRVVEVHPLKWQGAIGNPNLSKLEKQKIKLENPGKSENWYKNKGREFRKNRTKDFVKNNYNIVLESDNVADAFGIAYFASTALLR